MGTCAHAKITVHDSVVLSLTSSGNGQETDGFVPQLAAMRLSSDQIRPGGVLNLSLDWINAKTAPSDEEYTVFVHIRPAAPGNPDVLPATGGNFRPATPVYAWLPHLLLEEHNRPIKIPEDFPPGQCHILIGLYSQETGQREKLANDDNAVSGSRFQGATADSGWGRKAEISHSS